MLVLKIILLPFVCSLAYISLVHKPSYDIDHAEYYFNDFVVTYNKNYSTKEESQDRLKIFTENLIKFNERNSIDSAIHGVNQFSDLTPEEFSSLYTGLKPAAKETTCKVIHDGDVTAEAEDDGSFDWREKKAVTPVKAQKECGSCYAFSTVGNIESVYAIRKGEQLDLSEQQIVSCANKSGCEGGLMTESMEYIIEAGGIELETSYPYVARQAPCTFDKTLVKVQLSGCLNYHVTDENNLKHLLRKNGPISIGIAGLVLHSYKGGIQERCPGGVDHGVLLVGYGTDPKKGQYWIVKNSWGSNWGEQGYFRMTLGKNTCSLMNEYLASAVIA